MCLEDKSVLLYTKSVQWASQTWSLSFLSKREKEVQVKYVVQTVPTFVMSCYLLPQSITDKMMNTTFNFWWSSKQNSRSLHWIAWNEICTPKDFGGLGFRDIHDFNIALLTKQLWRLIHYPNSLLARVLKGRYCNHTFLLEDWRTYSPSYVWCNIMTAKTLFIWVYGKQLVRSIYEGLE